MKHLKRGWPPRHVDCPLSWWRRPTSYHDDEAHDTAAAATEAGNSANTDDGNKEIDNHPRQASPRTSTGPAPSPTSDPDPPPSELSPHAARPLSEVCQLSPVLSYRSESQASQRQSILPDPSFASQRSSSPPSALPSQLSDPGFMEELFPSPLDSSDSLITLDPPPAAVSSSQDIPTESDLALAEMDVSETPDATSHSRSTSKRKLARVDPSRAPPARKSTAPYPVSNPRKKINNPLPS